LRFRGGIQRLRVGDKHDEVCLAGSLEALIAGLHCISKVR